VSARAEDLLQGLDDVVLDTLAERLAVRTSSPAPLLDAEQAGRLLNVPSTWLLAEARADRIPHVRLGRYVRFDAAELEVWWRARARGPWRARGAAASSARTRRTGGGPVAREAGGP
jgi:excisionase family DNA binding protein